MFKGLCLFIYLSCAAGKGSFLEENPYYAKTLNSQSFNKELAKDGDLLVMFYAPWCEHCKELSPAFEEAAKMLSQKESHLKVTLAKVDGSENEELAKKYGIQGYPTLRYFKEREVQVMDATNSGRSADEIFSFVKKIASAPDRITHIGDDAGMKKFFELGGVFAVGFFESAEHAEFFVGVAEKFRYPVRFGWTTIDDLAVTHLGLDPKAEPNRVVLLTPFDERRHVFAVEKPLDGTKKSKEEMANMMNTMMGVPLEEATKLIPESPEQRGLKDWVTKFMIPLVVPFEKGFMDLIFQGPLQAHLIAIVDTEEDYSGVVAALTEAAQSNRGEVLHIIMPANEQTSEIRDFFGVKSHSLPAVVFSDMRHASEDTPAGVQAIFDGSKAIDGVSLKEFSRAQLAKEPPVASKKGRPTPRKKPVSTKKKKTLPKSSEF